MQADQNVLFLCSMNRLRSPSAQRVFSCVPGLAVRSAGLDDGAARVCTLEDLQWADLVVVMEQAHTRQLSRKFGPALPGRKAIVLGIPDRYDLLQDELVELLLAKVPQFLAVAVDVPSVRACLALNTDASGLPPLATSHCW